MTQIQKLAKIVLEHDKFTIQTSFMSYFWQALNHRSGLRIFFEHPKCHIWGLASPKLTVALWANIFMGVFFTDTTGFKIVVILNAMIFAFTTFVKNTPLYGKLASKV